MRTKAKEIQKNQSNRGIAARLTHVILILIILICAIKWFLYIGFRIQFYEILALLFIGMFFVSSYKTVEGIKFPSPIRAYLLFLWGWFFLEVMSGIHVIINPLGPEAGSFFAKALLGEFVFVVFSTSLLLYLCTLDHQRRLNLIYWYVAGVVISSIYGFGQLILIQNYRVDLDSTIAIGLRLPTATIDSLEFSRYGYGQSYRITGITGDPSVHAAYTITALVLLIYLAATNHRIKNGLLFLIVFLSLSLSQSGSGFVGLVTSAISLRILQLRLKSKSFSIKGILTIILLFGTVLFLYSYYQEDINYYLSVRLDPKGTIASHLGIAADSLNIGFQNIVGVGLNNFSIAFEKEYGITGFNAHNVWITYFVELGIIGFLYRVIFAVYVIKTCLKRKTALSMIFVSSYVGLCIAALGYETLSMFYLQLYMLLFYAVVVLDSNSAGMSNRSVAIKRTVLRSGLIYDHDPSGVPTKASVGR